MRKTGLLALLAIAFSLASASASATVVERVVAVVGDRAILLSDVRERAKPFLVRIHQEVPAGAQRSAAISQTYKTLLERMVDEELEQRAANRSNIVVSAREVDEAISRIAAQNGLTIEQLITEATRSGLTESQYRSEVRRQVLEAKLLNLRIQGRIRVTEEDLRSAFRKIVVDERKKLAYRAAWIRIDASTGAARDELLRRRTLAERISEQARAGADFGALARAHSDDAATRDNGGLLGRLKPGQLHPTLDRLARTLEVGEVSTPLRVGDALFIMKVIERDESELPSFQDARGELSERVYLEKMSKARRHWLASLRRQTHVEVRL
jgi:peptidyl-prolyl cis-trans isomerase SurA